MPISTPSRPSRIAVALAGIALASLVSTGARATIINGSSSASGEAVSLTLTPPIGAVVTITSGPLPLSSGSGGSAYDFTSSALNAAVADVLSTGLLSTEATSTAGTPGSGTVGSTATVNNLSIGLPGGIGLTATTVQSISSITGTYGSLVGAATTTIEGLAVTGLVLASGTITPAANDVILSALGITITLNKQTITNTGLGSAMVVDNAIDIQFVNVVDGLEILNGSIDIGNTSASAIAVADTSVPEPGSLALLAGFAGSLMFAKRRRTL